MTFYSLARVACSAFRRIREGGSEGFYCTVQDPEGPPTWTEARESAARVWLYELIFTTTALSARPMSGCAISAGGLTADAARGVASNGQGGAFLVGRFTDQMSFTLPGSTAYTATSAGSDDSFHMTVDSSCSVVRVR